MKKLVLLSGGIDSTVCLAQAVAEEGAKNVVALTLSYGQKHKKEMLAAADIAQHYGVMWYARDLAEVFTLSDSPLLKGRRDIKHMSYVEQLAIKQGTVDTYVPFRNGLFLSYAAAIAYSINAQMIYYGAHADDAAGNAYPDCTPEFQRAMGAAISLGTAGAVGISAPLQEYNKAGIVTRGLRLGVPFHLTWSCYEGEEKPCGTCGTCIDRQAAFLANNVDDPADYKEQD